MKLKFLAAAAMLAVSGASMAATFNLGNLGPPGAAELRNDFTSTGSFSDTYNFTLSGGADSFGGVFEWGDIPFVGLNLSLTSVSLSGTGLSSALIDNSPLFFSFSNLVAGSYSLVVNGTVTKSLFSRGDDTVGYKGGIATINNGVSAPVPEPETIAMMALGLGVMGFVARRRKQLGK